MVQMMLTVRFFYVWHVGKQELRQNPGRLATARNTLRRKQLQFIRTSNTSGATDSTKPSVAHAKHSRSHIASGSSILRHYLGKISEIEMSFDPTQPK